MERSISLKNISKILKDIIIGYPIICLFLLGIFLYLIHYLTISTADVPLMDYWRMIDQWGEKIMSGTLRFKDIWAPSTPGQRVPLLAILLFINMRFFGYNTQIGIFAGAFFIVFTAICLIYAFLKENHDKQEHKLKIQLLCLPIILAVFSFNKWGIMILEFSLPFMIRIFSYIVIFIWLNRCLMDVKKHKYQIIIVSALIIIIICLISGPYLVAFAGTIGIVAFIHFCIHYKNNKFLYLRNYSFLYAGIIIGIAIYLFNLGYVEKSGIVSVGLFLSGFIKGTLLMFGASICQTLSVYPLFSMTGYSWMLIMGTIVGLLYIFSIFLYFYRKMYQKTYIPLFLILYCFINIAAVYYARASIFDIYYLTGSRYTCETTLGIIGIIWIFANEILNAPKMMSRLNIVKMLTISIGIIIISGGLVYTMYSEKKIGVHRGRNFAKAREIMLKIDNTPDSELRVFISGRFPAIRSGIKFLEKYNLGIFRNNRNNKNIQNEEIIILSGFYADGRWTDGNASITVNNKTATHFSLTGLHPEHMGANRLTVMINNKETVTVDIISGRYNVELDFENTLDNVYISLKTDKAYIPREEGWNNDARLLGAYITSWTLSEKVKIEDRISGFYADGRWTDGNASIIVNNNTATHFSLTGFHPEHMGANRLTIMINNKETVTIDMISGRYNAELDFENTLDNVYISLKTDKAYIPREEGWNNDARLLGAYITSWKLSED
jgi:hypothetical protein